MTRKDRPQSPDEVKAEARSLRAKARRDRERAQDLLENAAAYEKAAETLEARDAAARRSGSDGEDSEQLPKGEYSGIILGVNTEEFSQGLKISHGKARSALAKAAVRHGMTLGELGAKLHKMLGRRVPLSSLSQAHSGVRPVRRDVAEAVEKLIKLPATKTNWPKGIRDDDE
jgi:hypothetical protein